MSRRYDPDLRCMRWPLGVLCHLDMATDARYQAVTVVHGWCQRLAARTGLMRP